MSDWTPPDSWKNQETEATGSGWAPPDSWREDKPDDKSGPMGTIEATGSGVAEGAIGLGGFKTGMSAGAKLSPTLARFGTPGKIAAAAAPIVGGLIGMAGANRATKAAEDVVGIRKDIDAAQAAHPYVTMAAQAAPMLPEALTSVGNLTTLAKTNPLKAVGKVGLGAGAGAGLVYPQHLADKAIASLTGGEQPQQDPGVNEYLAGAGMGAVLGGAHAKVPEVKKTSLKAVEQTEEPAQPESTEPLLKLDQEEGSPAAQEAAVKSEQATNVAIESNLEAGNEETAKALSEIATDKSESSAEVDDTATQEVSDKAPIITDSARKEAEKLGVDISQVPPNKQGKITQVDVRKWQKTQSQTETTDETQVPESIPQSVGAEEAVDSEPGTVEQTADQTVDQTGVLPDLQTGEEPVETVGVPNSSGQGSQWAVIPSDGPSDPERPVVFLKIGDRTLPFYRSSKGTSGKKEGGWFPFFGAGSTKGADWIIKGSGKDLESGHGVPEIKRAQDFLNQKYQGTADQVIDQLKAEYGETNGMGLRMISKQLFGKHKFEEVSPEKGAAEHIDSILSGLKTGEEQSTQDASAATETPAASQTVEPLPPKENGEQDEAAKMAALEKVYPDYEEISHDIRQSVIRAKNKKEFVKWLTGNYNAAGAKEAAKFYDEVGPILEMTQAEPEAPEQTAPSAKVTAAAQKYAEEKGVDVSQLTPNKYGNVTKKEVDAYLASIPKEPEATEPEVTNTLEEETASESASNPEMTIEPYPVDPNALKQQPVDVSAKVGFGISGNSLNPSKISNAVYRMGKPDNEQLKQFFERVHQATPSGTQPVMSDAIVTEGDKGTPVTVTRYQRNFDYDHLRAIEALKARASGKGGTVFKVESGGKHRFYQIKTTSNDFQFIQDQLQKIGLEDAVLSRDPDTENVTVSALSLDKSADRQLLGKLKQFVYENNYEKIQRHYGTAEEISSDPAQQSAAIKESLGRYTSGGRDGRGGGDRVRVANTLWSLAKETGVEGVGPKEPFPEQDKFDKLGERISKQLEGLSERKRREILIKLEPARKDLAGYLGLQYDPIDRKGNSPIPRDPDTGERLDQVPRGHESVRDYPQDTREQAYDNGVDRLVKNLIKYANGDVKETKRIGSPEAQEKLENLSRDIAILDEARQEEGGLSPEEELKYKELVQQFDEATHKINPWVLGKKGLFSYALGGAKSKIVGILSKNKTLASRGIKFVNPDDIVGQGEADDANQFLEKNALQANSLPQPIPGENMDTPAPQPVSNQLKAAVKFAQNKSMPMEDRLAVLHKIGEFVKAGGKEGASSDLALSLLNTGQELGKKADGVQQKFGRIIAEGFPLADILNGNHRDKAGNLLPADPEVDRILQRPSFSGQATERTGPPRIVSGTTAHEYLSRFVKSDAVDRSYSGLLKQLLQVNNLKTVPLSVVDYLPNNAYGVYNPRSGRIFINQEMMGYADNDFHTATEEIIHSLTGYFTDDANYSKLSARQRSAVDALRRMFEDSKSEMIKRGLTSQEDIDRVSTMDQESLEKQDHEIHYRFTNIQEWIAGITSSPEFRDSMDSLDQGKVSAKSQSIWDRVMNFLGRLFGLSPKSIHEQAFKKIMQLATEREAGQLTDGETLQYRPANKPSQALRKPEFQELSDADNIAIDGRTLEQSDAESKQYVQKSIQENGLRAAYDKLLEERYTLHPQVEVKAFLEFSKIFKEIASQYAGKSGLNAKEIVARNIATDLNRKAFQESQKTISGFASGLNAAKKIPDLLDVFAKGVLGGKSVKEAALNGGIDTAHLVDSMKQAFRDAGSQTIKDFSKSLEKFGLGDPEAKSTLTEVLGHTETSRQDLVEALFSLTGDKAAEAPLLAKELEARFNRNLAERTQKMRLSPEVARYARFGSFDDMGIHGAALDSLGIKGFDSAFANEIRTRVAEIEKLPENSSQRRLLTARLNGDIGNRIITAKFQKSFFSGLGQVLSTLPEIFRSAILTGPPTLLTHGLSGFVNSRLEGSYLAMGHFTKALQSGHSFTESLGFFRDFLDSMILNSHGDLGNSSIRNFGRVIRTGEGAFNLAEGQGRRGLDAYAMGAFGNGAGARAFQMYAGGMAYLPRLLGAFDELNSGTALDLNRRLATRAELLNRGVKGGDISESMRKAFAPTNEELAAVRKQLDEEVEKGFFKGLNKIDEYHTLADRLLQLHQEGSLPDEVLGKEEDLRRLSKNWTLKGDPKGLAGSISGMLATANRTTKVSTFFVPFTRIIANLMNNSLDYTPMGFLKAQNASISNFLLPEGSTYAYDKMTKGSPEQIALMAKSVLGTGVGLFLTSWFLKELHEEEETGKPPAFTFYGEGPKDSFKRKQWEESGARANTIKIGDSYFPYKAIPGIDLLGTALGTLHDYVKYEMPLPKLKHGHQYTQEQIDAAHKLSGDKLWRCAIAVAMSPLQHHFLSGMRNLIEVMHDPQGPGGPRAAMNQVVGSLSQVTDPQIFRVLRNTLAKDSSGEVTSLDLTSPMGQAAQFVPFFSGYNTPQLNVLGDPIKHNPADPLVSRWLLVAQAKPDPIIAPLVDNGLFIPGPKKSTSILIDNKGNMSTLSDAGQDAWRAYVVYRGQFLKRVLSPGMVQRLTSMDRLHAQSILDGPSINSAASKVARLQVERDIRQGKIKINKI